MTNLAFLDQVPRLKGYTTILSFNPVTGQISQMVHQYNMIMDGAALCMANLLLGDVRYKVGAMYFEFVNLANPGDTPIPPAFDVHDDVTYFTGLQFSSNTDFLRVPVITNAAITETTHNSYLISFYAVTPGSEFGFWNKPFDAAHNSAVYGGALVATPVFSSQADDIVIARNYPAGAKVMKPVGEQICMVWNLEILKP